MDNWNEKKLEEVVKKIRDELEKEHIQIQIEVEETFQILETIRKCIDGKEKDLEENEASFQRIEEQILKQIEQLKHLVLQPESDISEMFTLLDSMKIHIEQKYVVYCEIQKDKKLLEKIHCELKKGEDCHLSDTEEENSLA